MTGKRTEELLCRVLRCINQLESGQRLYRCLHDSIGMSNAEIEEAGYTLWEYYEKDTPRHGAAANGIQYASLKKLEQQAKEAVEFIIQEGTRSTEMGDWEMPFSKLEEETGLSVSGQSYLQDMLCGMLAERVEVSLVSTGESSFDVTYCPEYCSIIQAGKGRGRRLREPDKMPVPAPVQMLRDLIASPFLEVCLISEEEFYKDPQIIPELCIDALTEAGREEWADVLDAEVGQIYMGLKGLEVSLVGVENARLEAFSSVLAGQCSDELHEKWVADTEEIYLARTQQLKR